MGKENDSARARTFVQKLLTCMDWGFRTIRECGKAMLVTKHIHRTINLIVYSLSLEIENPMCIFMLSKLKKQEGMPKTCNTTSSFFNREWTGETPGEDILLKTTWPRLVSTW